MEGGQQMSDTPRTDDAKEQYLTGKMGIYGVLDEARKLETELARLRAEVERLKGMASWAHTCIHHNDAERAGAACPCCAITRAEKAEADFATERAIVSRIWVQLGSPTYAELKGRSIYDLIDEMKARAQKAEAEAKQLINAGVNT
jgi:hypothetical protein